MTTEELRILRECCADETSFKRVCSLFAESHHKQSAFKTAFEESRDGLWVLHPSMRTAAINRRLRKLMQLSDTDAAPEFDACFDAEILNTIRQFAAADLEQPPLQLQAKVQTMDGSQIECALTIQSLQSDLHVQPEYAGNNSVLVSIRPNSEDSLLQASLDKSQRDFETIFHTSGHALILLNPLSEEILDINAKACDLFDLPRERLLGIPLLHIAPVADANAVHLEENEGRAGVRFRTVQYGRAGVELSLEITACIISHNNKSTVLCCVYDRTAERELVRARGSSVYFRSVFDAAGVGLITIDPRGTITQVNRAAEELLGCEKAHLLQQDLSILLHPSDTLIDKAFIREMALGEKHMMRLPRRLKNAEGHYPWFNSSLAIVRSATDSAQTFLVLSFEQILANPMENDDMRRLLDTARRSDMRKSRLLTELNQAVRSPVNGILGFASYLQNADLDEQSSRAVRAIMSSADSILGAVSNTALLAQLGELVAGTHVSAIHINSEIKDIWRTYERLTRGSQTEIVLHNRAGSSLINTDSLLFNRMLANVVANAVRFTARGTITIDVHTESAGENGMLVLTVSDNGMGFARETVRTILHAPPQAILESGTGNAGYDPTFSLRISRFLAEYMNGSLMMESLVGSGTTVTIRLPLLQDSTTASLAQDDPALKEMQRPRILLVEDDRLGRELISYFVRDRYTADVVSNGAKAIGLCQRNNYDALVLDIRLGNTSLDGIGTLHRLREIEGYAKTPAIAVSAMADQGARERFLREGFADYIPKPFNRERLLTTLSTLLSRRSRSREIL